MADLTTKLKNVFIINGIIALSTLLTLDLYNYYTEITVLTQKDTFYVLFFFNVQHFSENNTENVCISLILESMFICIFACMLQ